MIDFDFNNYCYGCCACQYSCPTQAIHMEENIEGFMMPVLDMEKCFQCGKCEKVCPKLITNKTNREIKEAVYKAAYRKDISERKTSASGGVAAVLTDYFLEKSSVVVGCGWDKVFVAKHILLTTPGETNRIKGSKYVQSDMQQAYLYIKSALEQGKKVLFIGTPCQVAAVKNVFPQSNEIYTISLICGGVGSPAAWKSYKDGLEIKYKSKMIEADFRHKGRYGWSSPVALYRFENRKCSDKLAFHNDSYVLEYLMGTFKRNSCFNCQYKGNLIPGDLIIGDFWGNPHFRNKSENMGVSAILSMTTKGDQLLSYIHKDCEVCDTTLEDILKGNQPLIYCVKPKKHRSDFFYEMNKSGYHKAWKKYSNYTNKHKYWLMLLLDKTRLFELVKRTIKE